MGVKKDTLQVSLQLDGKQAINQLGKLEMEYADVRRTLKGLKKDHKDYQALRAKETELTNAIRKQRKELGLQGMTLQQLIRHTQDLDRIRRNSTTRGTAMYKKLTKEIREANTMIAKQRMEARRANTVWNRLSKSVQQFGILALSYLGGQMLVTHISNLSRKLGELSDRLSAVQKTTGLSAKEVDILNKRLSQMNTRTARKELLEMAKVAGKLGITALRDVEGFVRAFDKINIALGEDIGAPDEAAKKLGKIVEAFGVNDNYNIEESLLRVGSAINHLGKSSTANEGYIIQFTKRLAGVAPMANLSVQDVMGLAAANDALGQTSEVSSTALSKLFVKMVNNREEFVKYTRSADGSMLSMEEYSNLINTDFNEAFLSLLRGVKGNSEGMIALGQTLQDLELDGGRVIGVLGTLANNTDLLRKQQAISNQEFEKGTSVLNEYNLMNDNLAAKMAKARKVFYRFFVNSTLSQALENFVGMFLKLTEVDIAEKLEEERSELNILVGALMNANDNERVRLSLINEINAKYPDFLAGMDKENLNMKELASRLETVNKQYQQKIIIQAAEEEIQALLREEVELVQQQIKLEKDLQKLRQDNDQQIGSSVKGGQTSKSAIADRQEEWYGQGLQKRLETINAMIEEKTAARDELLARFGNLMLPSAGGSPISTGEDPGGGGGGLFEPVKQISSMFDLMSEQIDSWYEEELLKLKYQRNQKLITEEEYNQRERELRIAHAMGMQEAAAQNGKSTLEYEQMIADEKYAIEKDLQDKRDKLGERNRDKQRELSLEGRDNFMALADNIAYSFSAMSAVVAEQSEEGIRRQLAFAQASIISSRGVALASAIEGAAKASSSTGPLAPFTLAAYISSMVGTVFGAFADLKGANSQAKAAMNQVKENKKSKSRSFYFGGETGYETMTTGDAYGGYTGYTHAGEFVTPSWVRSDPSVIDAEKLIKARMAGYSLSTTSTASGQSDEAARMIYEAALMMTDTYAVLFKKGLRSELPDETLKKANERLQSRTQTQNRGALS